MFCFYKYQNQVKLSSSSNLIFVCLCIFQICLYCLIWQQFIHSIPFYEFTIIYLSIIYIKDTQYVSCFFFNCYWEELCAFPQCIFFKSCNHVINSGMKLLGYSIFTHSTLLCHFKFYFKMIVQINIPPEIYLSSLGSILSPILCTIFIFCSKYEQQLLIVVLIACL